MRLWLLILSMACAGCDFVPEGTTRFRFKADKEFDTAMLTRTEGSVDNVAIKLRYADTNTFSTSETLAGRYAFSARSYQGAFYRHEFDVIPGENFYEMPAHNTQMSAPAKGPMVRGRLAGTIGASPRVTVLFISTEVISRSVTVRQNAFEAEAPRAGQYRVQVVEMGAEPKVWVSPVMEVSGNVDLGLVELK